LRWKLWDRYGLLALLVLAVTVLSLLRHDFLSVGTFRNLLSQTAPVGIAAAGMTLVITTGGFDLSIGAMLALVTVVLAKAVPVVGVGPAIALALGASLACGLLNGLVITRLGIQTFIATLATMMVFRGMALSSCEGRDINLVNFPQIKVFSSTPWLILLTAGVYGLSWVVYRHSPLGIRIRAIGSNPSAAWSSGINVNAARVCVFAYVAMTTGVAAVIRTSQLAMGGGNLGMAFELEAITVVILGGTALSGGRGRLWGSLVATALLGVMRMGLDFFNVKDEYQRLAVGGLLVAALAINGLRGGRARELAE
jgi:ribose/xylose/arabinose/galactoside ABC-type transport system permease subunit